MVEKTDTLTEVVDTVDEETLSREDMEALYETTMKGYKEGEIVTGTVMSIGRDSVIVDVGMKSEGMIPIHEFPGGPSSINEGDVVEVLIEKTEDDNAEGVIVLSIDKALKMKKWEELQKIHDEDKLIKGTPVGKIKGGLAVDIGLRAFLPGSQIDVRPPKNMDEYLYKEMEFKIIKMNKRRGNIVLSRRAIIEEERKASRSTVLSTLEEGEIVEGVVKNITDYGAFIDLGGVDGLLHITDISWGRVNHPSEALNIGDTIKVVVLKFDKESERVSLGLKQHTDDPWKNIEEKFAIGTKVVGKVVSITDYGAFLELEPGVEGLVHISEMTWSKHVRHPSRIVEEGEEVDAEVLNTDKERKRISLGIKQLKPNPWDNIEERYPIGTQVDGVVRNLTDFGAFVEIEEGVDGLIHISDMSWTEKIKHPSEIVKKKDSLTTLVLKIDKENERISLGLKQLGPDPWDSIDGKFSVGDDIKVKIVKITNFGAFAEIEPGVEGLIHASQIADATNVNPRNELEVDQEVEVKIIKVELAERKIALSIKALGSEILADNGDYEMEDFPEEE